MSIDTTTASKLLEEDRLRLKLADETGGRLLAERQNLNYQIAQLSARAKKHAEDKGTLESVISKKYGLKPNDEINMETGELIRAPIEKASTPPELPAPPPEALPQPHPSLTAMAREPAQADPHPNGATAPIA